MLEKSRKQQLTRMKSAKLRPKRSTIENTPPSSKSSYASSSTSSSPLANNPNGQSTRLVDLIYRNINTMKKRREYQKKSLNESDTTTKKSSDLFSSQSMNGGFNHLKVSDLNLKLIKSMTQRAQQLSTRTSKENKQRRRSAEKDSSVANCQSILLASPPLSLSLSSSSLGTRSNCSPTHSNISSTATRSGTASPNSSSSSTSIKLSLRFHNNSNGQRVGIVVNNHSKSKRII